MFFSTCRRVTIARLRSSSLWTICSPRVDADHHRIVAPPDPLAFVAEGGDALDDQVGRGDLVEQQIVALARGAADRFGAAGAEPERRVRLLDRVRLDDDVVEVPALAVMREPALARPRLADHVHRLVEPLGRLVWRDAEAGEFVGRDSPCRRRNRAGRSTADRGSPPARRPGSGCARAAPRPRCRAGCARCARRDSASRLQRRRDLAEAGEMVLDEKDARKAELLGLDDIVDEVVIAGAVARRAAARARPAEKPEFHASPSSRVVARIYGAIRTGSMIAAARSITAM